jgi:hypothetical protein
MGWFFSGNNFHQVRSKSRLESKKEKEKRKKKKHNKKNTEHQVLQKIVV